MTQTTTVPTIRDDLAANMLPSIRDTFHLNLLPEKGVTLTAIDAQFGKAVLSATLARAEMLADRLQRRGDIGGVIGTTPAIIDGLRNLFNNPTQPNLIAELRQQQARFNAHIDPADATARAIAPYLKSIIPPTERPKAHGFGC